MKSTVIQQTSCFEMLGHWASTSYCQCIANGPSVEMSQIQLMESRKLSIGLRNGSKSGLEKDVIRIGENTRSDFPLTTEEHPIGHVCTYPS